MPQHPVGFIIKRYIGISKNAVYRYKMLPIGSMSNNRYPIMWHCAKASVSLLAFL